MSIHITEFNPAKQGLGYLPVHYSDGTMSVYIYHPDCDDSKKEMLIDIHKQHYAWLISRHHPANLPSIKRVDCIDQLIESYGGYFELKESLGHDLEYRIISVFNSISIGDTIGAARTVSHD